jgi:cytochrome P450
MQDIRQPDANDTNTINAILKKFPDGPEHERQRGMLAAVLAGEAPFRIQGKFICISSQLMHANLI